MEKEYLKELQKITFQFSILNLFGLQNKRLILLHQCYCKYVYNTNSVQLSSAPRNIVSVEPTPALLGKNLQTVIFLP